MTDPGVGAALDLDALAAAYAQTTPEPWVVVTSIESAQMPPEGETVAYMTWELTLDAEADEWIIGGQDDRGEFEDVQANVEWVSMAHAAFPALIAEVRRLREARDRAVAMCHQYEDGVSPECSGMGEAIRAALAQGEET